MVTIHSLHSLFIGIFFLVVSQIAPFQESLLSFMLIIGVILLVAGIIGRTAKTIGKKIRKELGREGKQKSKVSTNYYFTYFLIFLAFVFTFYGYMTMPNIL